ncbi:MAG: hypothetical protein VCC01_02415 [Candidatus Hydrogenedentota bacterium]
MADGFYITCGCGYELYIPEADIGTEQECINCGADLDTHPSAVSTEKDSAKEDVLAPPEVSSFVEAEHSPYTGPTVSSPFEDDDESEVPAPQSAASQTEPEEPPDYAASIFEDDSDKAEEDAQTENTPDPSKIRTYHDPEHTAAYQGSTETETCPRCGNVYRGEWDKQLIDGETICYICSNQATEGLPERLKQDRAVAPNPVTQGQNWSGSVTAEIPEGPIEERFWLFSPESDEFRIMIYVLAFGMVFVTILLVIFGDFSPPTPSDQPIAEVQTETEAQPELPAWATAIYWSWRMFIMFAGQFLSIYMVLSLTDRLPHGKIIKDFVIVGYTMLLLAVMTAIYFGLASTIGQSMMGPVLMLIVNVICGLPCIWIMMNVLDFRIRDFFYLMFISGFVHSFLHLISLVVYAGLAKIAL